MPKIYFPQYARGRDGVNIAVGETVLSHIRRTGGVEIDSECGGQGVCCKDVIRVERGAISLTQPTQTERNFLNQGRLRPGHRLACQTKIAADTEDITVFIPDFGRYTILTEFAETDTALDPCVSTKDGRVVYHTGEDLGPYLGRILGLAIDVGTTTLVMQLVDLETGKGVGKPVASKNPQIAYGNDIISRIGYTRDHETGLKELHEVVVDGLNRSLAEFGRDLGNQQEKITGRIYDVVAVGNSTMRSLFFSQNVHNLGIVPFEPDSKQPLTRKARCLGLNVHPEAMVYGPPLIGGHAGADCLADIIATRIYENQEVSMMIDIGTNGEVVIGNREGMITASCAAGGAYEGYQIKCGVGAIQGAITQVRIENGRAVYKTLGDKPPLGVCGSGVIDLLAELVRNGIVNSKARMQNDYCITDSVRISQDDVNQLIVAKAGLRTDQDLLIKYFKTDLAGVTHIYLAGGFGNFMNIDNAMEIGLLPKTDRSKFVRFGNGALAGARDMLLSHKRRNDAETVIEKIRHTKPNELEGAEFQYMVAERMYFE